MNVISDVLSNERCTVYYSVYSKGQLRHEGTLNDINTCNIETWKCNRLCFLTYSFFEWMNFYTLLDLEVWFIQTIVMHLTDCLV